MKKLFSLLLALTITAGLLAGCGSSKSMAVTAPQLPEYVSESSAAYDNGMGMAPADTMDSMDLPQGRKFIITVDAQTETDDLDGMLASLNQQISALSGYVESQHIRNGSSYATRRYRNANLTIRIPADRLTDFTQSLSELSNVVSTSRDTQDVTLSYVDTQSRITALETEQTRLLELLAQAADMTDLLAIESRLTEVRYQLQQYNSTLRVLDNQIDYATVNLDIEEVTEYTPAPERTRWQQITQGFMDSLKGLGTGILDFISWIIINIPYLATFVLVVALIVFLCRRISKKRREARIRRMIAQQKQDPQQ